MRKLFSLFIFSFSFLATRAQTFLPKTVNINSNCGGYYEYLPVNYSSTTTKYPLIVYIHGGACYGSGTTAAMAILLKVEGIPIYITKGAFPATFPVPGGTTSFIVIVPQFKTTATPAQVNQVIDYALANYRVDRTRTYLTGYSLGGGLAWKTPSSAANAIRLAAQVPVAGYNNPYVDTTAKYIAGANLPVWAIHSNSDVTAPVAWSVNFVNKINSFNPAIPAIITRINGYSHDSTVTAAFNPTFRPNGKNIYEWLLQYSRNYPPVAKAGNDISITLPTSNITLDGSSSTDPEGGALTFKWNKISGPSRFTFSDSLAAKPAVTNLVAGIYNFKLSVTDNIGQTTFDTVQVTVINPNPNQPPTARAGNDQIIFLPTTSVTLDGTASSDPDGIVDQVGWTKISGPASFVIANPAATLTQVTNLKTGVYQFKLTATDNQGAFSFDTIVISVINPFPNKIPVSNAGPDQTITAPANVVSLDGSQSLDSDGVITSFTWRQLNGSSVSNLSNANAAGTTAGNLTPGTYQFELTVSDDSSAQKKDTVLITVNPVPVIKNVQVNLYAGANPAGSGWNNWNVATSLNMTSSLYSDGTVSPLSANLSANAGVADNGTGYPTTMCPVEVGRTASYGTSSRTLTLSGLDNTEKYDLAVYSTRYLGNPTIFTIGTTAINIATDRNYTNAARYNSIVSSGGKITMKIDLVSSFNYINGFTLTEYKNPVFPNTKPVAVTGGDQTINLPVNQVTISGAGSLDSDGSIASYNWQEISGPTNATIISPAGMSTSVNNLNQGVYTFQLTVTDNKGAIATATTQVTVNAPLGLVANAGSDQSISLPLDSVILSASGSFDNIGTINGYSWNKISGPASFNILIPSGQNTEVKELVVGTYIFELVVTDDQGHISKDSISIFVSPKPNAKPVANAGPDQAIQLPLNTVQLNGQLSSDSDGFITSYLWRKIAGPAVFNISDSTVTTPTLSNLFAGNYQFLLTVTDNAGGTGTDTVIILVNPAPNQLPVANAGADILITLPLNNITLNGSGNDPDGTITAYHWTKISGPVQFSINNANISNPTISNLTYGTYGMVMEVTDNSGGLAVDTVLITVLHGPNLPPVANAGPDQVIYLPASSTTLTGTASADPDGVIVSYNWRQIAGPGPGTLSNGTQVSAGVSGLVQGTYSFELSVTDDSSAVAYDTVQVIVNVSQGPKFIKVNIYGGSFPAGTGWNNWNVQSSLTLGSSLYSDGNSSSMTAVLSSNSGVSDNGASYTNTICPNEVGRTTSYAGASRTLTLSGLDNSKNYDLEIYSCRVNGSATIFTVGSSVFTTPYNNNSVKATFTNLTPVGGKIILKIDIQFLYNYINGFMLTENSSQTGGQSVGNANMQLSATSETPEPPGEGLTVSPNPFHNQLQFRIVNNRTGKLRISILSESGKSLQQLQFEKESTEYIQQVSLGHLPKGVYFIQAQMNGWIETRKMIKF